MKCIHCFTMMFHLPACLTSLFEADMAQRFSACYKNAVMNAADLRLLPCRKTERRCLAEYG